LFFLTLFMYLSDPLWKKKGFDLNYIIIVGIYLLNNAKIYSKYDIRYFQSLIQQEGHDGPRSLTWLIKLIQTIT
jgi:hypothetical protein